MPLLSPRILLISAILSLAACTGNPAPPNGPPPISMAPEIAEGWHGSFVATKTIDAPLVPLIEWISASNELVEAMEETDRIKKPVEVKVVSGRWPEVGAVRWIRFSDGHYTYERVLENNLPFKFQYQVWGLTSGASAHITYARGKQEWRVLDDGRSELTWIYELRPNSIIKRPFISGFLSNDMMPFMEGALHRMTAKAEIEFAGWRESQLRPIPNKQ